MKVKLHRRGRIEPEGVTVLGDIPAVFSAVKPVNDLLGLRDDATYLSWLEADWQRWATRRSARKWLRDGVPRRFAEATRKAATGRFPYALLSDLLGQVRFATAELDAPDLPALAAWALQEAIQRDGYRIRKCDECGYLWLTVREKARYCYRPAPGKLMTCAQLHAHERFGAQRERWNKEYRRIYARKLRGTVSESDWQAWRQEGTGEAPSFFVPFDIWKQLRDEQEAARRAVVESERRKHEQAVAALKAAIENIEKKREGGSDG